MDAPREEAEMGRGAAGGPRHSGGREAGGGAAGGGGGEGAGSPPNVDWDGGDGGDGVDGVVSWRRAEVADGFERAERRNEGHTCFPFELGLREKHI